MSDTQTLALEQQGPVLHLTLNRPDVRNAMSLTMVQELHAVFDQIENDPEVRIVVLRGAGGHFCAGGDIKDMAQARGQKSDGDEDPFFTLNRAFGRLITRVQRAPQTVVAVLEGSVMGGGFGLACVSDVALTRADSRFALPETTLGIPPAQIAPFVVRRIGLTQARRLALMGMKLNGEEACRLGVAHECLADGHALDQRLEETLMQIRRCAPNASRVTKQLLLDTEQEALEPLLDRAAQQFAEAIRSDEGQEGTMAFMQKRNPHWAE